MLERFGVRNGFGADRADAFGHPEKSANRSVNRRPTCSIGFSARRFVRRARLIDNREAAFVHGGPASQARLGAASDCGRDGPTAWTRRTAAVARPRAPP